MRNALILVDFWPLSEKMPSDGIILHLPIFSLKMLTLAHFIIMILTVSRVLLEQRDEHDLL